MASFESGPGDILVGAPPRIVISPVFYRHVSLICKAKPVHGYWPARHHPYAINLAMQDAPPRRKLYRMLNSLCLICGSELIEVETHPTILE